MSDDPSVKPTATSPSDPLDTGTVVPDPCRRGDEASKAILKRLLNELSANEPGVLQNLDPECLHDYRIAVRRTRSALGQIKGIFPRRSVERFRPRFAWLGKITSPPP